MSVLKTVKMMGRLGIMMLIGVVVCPASTSPSLVSLPLETWQTPQGVQVWFSPSHHLPMLDVGVVFDAGAVRDGRVPGLAYATNHLLMAGCGAMHEKDVAEQLDQAGAQYGAATTMDYSQHHLRTLTDPMYLKPALDVLTQCLAQPRFETDAIGRFKKQMTTFFAQWAKDPVQQGIMRYRQKLYGSHPYGHYVKGNPRSLQRWQQKDLKQFYQKHHTRANMHIVMVGDVTSAQAHAMASRLASAVQPGAPLPKIVPPTLSIPPKHMRIHMPLKQTTVILGHPGITYTDPLWPALSVANQVLGQGMPSRLFTAVRENKGYAYSPHSLFVRRRLAGSFFVVLKSRNEVARDAQSMAMHAVGHYLKTGPTADELAAAKQIKANRFIRHLATNAGRFDQLVHVLGMGAHVNQVRQWLPKVAAVTQTQTLQALTKILGQSKWTTIEIGPNVKL